MHPVLGYLHLRHISCFCAPGFQTLQPRKCLKPSICIKAYYGFRGLNKGLNWIKKCCVVSSDPTCQTVLWQLWKVLITSLHSPNSLIIIRISNSFFFSPLFLCDSSDGTSWTVTTTCLRTPAAQIPSSCLGCMWVEPTLYLPTQRAGFQVHTCTDTTHSTFGTVPHIKARSRSILQFHWHYLTEQRLTSCTHTWKQHDLCTTEK